MRARRRRGAPTGLVVFAPVNADCVGTFDASSSTFACVSISATLSDDYKFRGAATAPNGLVVFATSNVNCFGTYDASSGAFACTDISTIVSGSGKFRGAATAVPQAVRPTSSADAEPPVELPVALPPYARLAAMARRTCASSSTSPTLLSALPCTAAIGEGT